MTKRTVLLLALAATTGVPAMAACSTAERQAPLPPQATGPATTGSVSSTTQGSDGASVPLTANGQAVPTAGTVGSNVSPGVADSSGGLRTRPGYAPGSAASTSAVPDSYRIGARAPWGILLDDRPQPEPLPLPAPQGVRQPRQTGDSRQDGQQPASPEPALPEPALSEPALPEPAKGGDGTILADGPGPAGARVQLKGNDIVVAPGQSKQGDDTAGNGVGNGVGNGGGNGANDGATDGAGSGAHDEAGPTLVEPSRGLPSTISFPALLSVPSPAAVSSFAATADGKPGNGPKGMDDANPASTAHQSGDAATSNNSERQPSATPLPLPSPLQQVLQQEPPTPDPTATPTTPAPQPSRPPAPAATGWHIDGLALQNAAPATTGKGGSPKFRKALRAALAARPDGQRPGPASLRRWSAALQKAAALAPDARTKSELHTLARYAQVLAGTAGPKRTALQTQHPGAIDAASALRAALPRRFGVALLG